jgi:hypothetical protein
LESSPIKEEKNLIKEGQQFANDQLKSIGRKIRLVAQKGSEPQEKVILKQKQNSRSRKYRTEKEFIVS